MAQPILSPVFAWFTSAGLPASGYKLNTYFAGTSTPQATYTDSTLGTPNANPVVLNSQGYAPVWIGSGTYKFVLTDSLNNVIWTADNVSQAGGGGSGGSSSTSEWVTDTAVPTFISATSFSFVGDRTSTYHVNRRIKSSNTAGTIYSTITAASFGAGITTITVSNDSGALDSGLSSVSYGILDSVNVSYPANIGGGGGSTPILYNGDFGVWQRGAGGSASFTGISSRTYTADRWQAQHTGGSCLVTQVAGSVGRYGAKVQRTAGNAVTADVQFAQSLEINDCAGLAAAGTPLTISLNLKAGANYSPTSSNIRVRVLAGKDAGDTNILFGYTSPLSVIDTTFAITTTSTRYTLTGTIPAASGYTEFGVIISFTPVGTAGADDSITVEKVRLEANASATAFAALPFGLEVARCQRYYEKSFTYATAPAQNVGGSTNYATFIAGKAGATTQFGQVYFLVQKRTTPGFTSYNPAAANAQPRDVTAAGDCSAVGLSASGDRGFWLSCTGNAGTAVGNQIQVGWIADADIG